MSKEIPNEVKKRFEELFGCSFERGQEEVEGLIRRSVRMGINEKDFWTAPSPDGAKVPPILQDAVVMGGMTRISDRDFLKVAFFALIGLNKPEELGKRAKMLEDGKGQTLDV